MSRKSQAPKRKQASDPRYKDKLVAKLIDKLMWDGKKAVAEKIVYGAFDAMQDAKKDDPMKLFKQALDNIKPILEVRSRRVGGANYQVPMEVRAERRISLGMKWLILAARARGEAGMRKKLAGELIDALDGRGGAVKKREEIHRMAEANRAFAHYRW